MSTEAWQPGGGSQEDRDGRIPEEEADDMERLHGSRTCDVDDGLLTRLETIPQDDV